MPVNDATLSRRVPALPTHAPRMPPPAPQPSLATPPASAPLPCTSLDPVPPNPSHLAPHPAIFQFSVATRSPWRPDRVALTAPTTPTAPARCPPTCPCRWTSTGGLLHHSQAWACATHAIEPLKGASAAHGVQGLSHQPLCRRAPCPWGGSLSSQCCRLLDSEPLSSLHHDRPEPAVPLLHERRSVASCTAACNA